MALVWSAVSLRAKFLNALLPCAQGPTAVQAVFRWV